MDFTEKSARLLEAVKIQDHPTVQQLSQELAVIDAPTLAGQLDTDPKRITFWVNVYNSYIIMILREDPDLYLNRSAFFTQKRFTIAGTQLSFDDIERHLRRSRLAELGYVVNHSSVNLRT